MDSENNSTKIWDSFVGRLIENRYLILRKIAEGGIGAVYLAEDTKMMNREVVVKVLLENWTKDEDVRRKFDHEKEALARLDHPGIVSILDAGILPEDKPYIVMPFIAGRTLRQVMDEQNKLPLNFCADVIESFCEALETAHAAGILHRDIKPENIILTEQADRKIRVRLIDFGIARVMNSQVSPITEVERSVGTVMYIAPEQLMGSPNQKPSADTYSCGIVVYEMLTGKLPFYPRSVVDMWQMQSAGVKFRPSEIRPELTPEVDDLILKALAYEPTERFQEVLAFGRELAHSLRQLSLDSLYNFNPHKSEITIALTADKVSRFIEEPKSPSSSFEVKIDRRETQILSDKKTQSTEPRNPTEPIDSENLEPENSPLTKTHGNNRPIILRTSLWIGVIAFVLLISAVPLLIYMLYQPKTSNQPPATEPKNTDIIVLSNPTRKLEYFLQIQKMRDEKPYGEPFRATGREIFESGYKFKINLSVTSPGYLYIFNEGKNDSGKNVFNLLFPTPEQQQNIAKIQAAQSIETADYYFSGKPGKELIWLIWTKDARPELDEIIRKVPIDTGEMDNPENVAALQNFLLKASENAPESEKDEQAKKTILKSRDDILVYRMELEHN